MAWIRTNRTFGSALALFALVLQMALSFAHLHARDLYGGPLAFSLAGKSAAASIASHPSPASFSTIGLVRADQDALCPVCAAANLLRAAQVAEAPRLPPLPVAVATRPLPHEDAGPLTRPYLPPQSRAPPVA